MTMLHRRSAVALVAAATFAVFAPGAMAEVRTASAAALAQASQPAVLGDASPIGDAAIASAAQEPIDRSLLPNQPPPGGGPETDQFGTSFDFVYTIPAPAFTERTDTTVWNYSSPGYITATS